MTGGDEPQFAMRRSTYGQEMEGSRSDEGIEAAELLDAWAANDFDGFSDDMDSIAEPGQHLTDELRSQEGDARGIQSDLEDELLRLARITRGVLYLARHAIDLAMDPPRTGRFAARTEVLSHLLARTDSTRSHPD